MTQPVKKIIVASPDQELAALAAPLRQQGVEVAVCPDGAKALERALAWGAALIILDTGVGLIPAQKLFQILRANPRTEGTSFFFVGAEGESIDGFRRHRDSFISRPFNSEQLLAGVAGYMARQEEAEQVGRQDSDIEGKLQQVTLVDLLQIFNLNRKSGVLHLQDGQRRGDVCLSDGKVTNARTGSVEGEKAFYRLLGWETGKFWFSPGGGQGGIRICAPTEHLIMEGLRQADEMAAQADQLPAADSVLTLNVSPDALPPGLRPATQEVLLALQDFRRVQDLLDNCAVGDFEILQILRVLIEKEMVKQEQAGPERPGERQPLLTSEEILAIKERLGERDALLEQASAKMILLAESADQVNAFVQRLTSVEEFTVDGDFRLDGDFLPLGDVGRLAVGEMFSLRLFCVPVGSELGPLWHPYRKRLFGVVSLSRAREAQQAEEFFQLAGNIPAVHVDGHDAEDENFPKGVRDRQSLRRLLGFFAACYTEKLLPEEQT